MLQECDRSSLCLECSVLKAGTWVVQGISGAGLEGLRQPQQPQGMQQMMQQMMNNPMMQNMMNDPEMLRTILQSNPQVQQACLSPSMYTLLQCQNIFAEAPFERPGCSQTRRDAQCTPWV